MTLNERPNEGFFTNDGESARFAVCRYCMCETGQICRNRPSGKGLKGYRR
jgi:hypothetical protein